MKDGYPGELLDRFVTTDQPTQCVGLSPCPLTLYMPWLGSKTEKLLRRANDAVRLAYPAGEVRAVYRSNQVFNLHKDRISTQSQSSLIYQLEWRHCGCQYVGKTAQRFADRISQHVPKHIPGPTAETARPPKKRENPAEGYKSAVACCKNDKARLAGHAHSQYLYILPSDEIDDRREEIAFLQIPLLAFAVFFCHMLSSLSFCFYVYSPSLLLFFLFFSFYLSLLLVFFFFFFFVLFSLL